MIHPEPVVEVSRQIGSSTSEAFVCLQPLSHEDEAGRLIVASSRFPSQTAVASSSGIVTSLI